MYDKIENRVKKYVSVIFYLNENYKGVLRYKMGATAKPLLHEQYDDMHATGQIQFAYKSPGQISFSKDFF